MDVQREVESAIEAVLFASGEPVGVERLCMALDLDRVSVDGACRRLADRYRFERRGMRLLQLGTSYQLCSAPEHAEVIRRALESRRPARLSQTALEVLAVIAYFQPITRAYIDQIRGVDSAYTVSMLVDRGLIEECGRLPVPGRPIQYRTTQAFLRSFGLSNLNDLPDLPNVSTEEEKTGRALEERLAQLRGEEEAVEP
ncbi:SMC-Scp complex subunit ScpB [Flavonifractor sp. An92]|uniref:SMC-Scp complex subunit ScpB n=1 Tax=Flavonifractor sp. An92 TaxID=1965666 RepID=UPI000B3A26D8|nr:MULTISPECIES: SMC-Scp complex subunit ScpB [unclassified Flavonifractor]OUN07960.1 SMC-Scp complex subunit ScpB [Flavonifractor sp. An92]OUQ24707.1 SMC-Scp complex subunit ScpB [Flavonifractor sp. An135]